MSVLELADMRSGLDRRGCSPANSSPGGLGGLYSSEGQDSSFPSIATNDMSLVIVDRTAFPALWRYSE